MRLPNDTQRLSIIGATGSGKTQAAIWHLSNRNYHIMPWIVYDFKRDHSINSIPYIREIGLDDIPTHPGVYVVHPLPDQDEDVERQMWAIWERGGVGYYVDEGYMIGRNNRAFRALLTQGRSKIIPGIILSQRPVWMDRFVFSESDFFQVFRLQHAQDRKSVEMFVPVQLDQRNAQGKRVLPEFFSYYYDVGKDETNILRPVPDMKQIHATFARRLGAMEAARKKAV